LAGNPQAGSQPARGARKARGKPFQPTVAPRLWADGRPIISPGMSHIYQSNRQLRPYPWSRSPLAATAGRAFTRARNAAPLYPRTLREGGVRQRTFNPQFQMRLTVALRQQPGRLETTERTIAASLATSDSARNYFLGALGRRRCRKRTPGPPPLSSMNSTPAASKARRTAKSFAVVIDVSSSVSSARRIVVTLRAVSRARSSALQRMRARAALICALVSGFTALLTLSCILLFFIP